MPEKDQPDEEPQAAATAPVVGKTVSQEAEWPRLLARVVEGIVTAELHEFEDNVLAFLDSIVSDAYATFIWMCALVIGAGFIVTGLVLFLGVFLQWWAAFGLVGLLVIAMGALTRVGRRPRRRRRRKG
jgi:hypothetical protein